MTATLTHHDCNTDTPWLQHQHTMTATLTHQDCNTDTQWLQYWHTRTETLTHHVWNIDTPWLKHQHTMTETMIPWHTMTETWTHHDWNMDKPLTVSMLCSTGLKQSWTHHWQTPCYAMQYRTETVVDTSLTNSMLCYAVQDWNSRGHITNKLHAMLCSTGLKHGHTEYRIFIVYE